MDRRRMMMASASDSKKVNVIKIIYDRTTEFAGNIIDHYNIISDYPVESDIKMSFLILVYGQGVETSNTYTLQKGKKRASLLLGGSITEFDAFPKEDDIYKYEYHFKL